MQKRCQTALYPAHFSYFKDWSIPKAMTTPTPSDSKGPARQTPLNPLIEVEVVFVPMLLLFHILKHPCR
ncbi:hypothetical protein OUZ56_026187 [Daphnia magna]|uniref:Uncharacterized protein n=1 Tax=Daphnia magna TaxID=35525 RepID=A0ABQ9ZL32_9CRUS|nr:hypothetical protein OUZ56_026187 [Daphnia magna]